MIPLAAVVLLSTVLGAVIGAGVVWLRYRYLSAEAIRLQIAETQTRRERLREMSERVNRLEAAEKWPGS
jgi:hypothetical protein